MQYRPRNLFRTVLEGRSVDDFDALVSATALPRHHGVTGGSGISQQELVYGIPNAAIVRNTFEFAGDGGRFHDSRRGAWYACNILEASMAEVTYHLVKRLKTDREIPAIRHKFHYDDWQADFHAEFFQIDATTKFAEYLEPEPVPECYAAGQALARSILLKGGNGIVYPSVRFGKGGICVACFRPALVYRPRLADSYTLTVTLESSGVYAVQHTRRQGIPAAPAKANPHDSNSA
ncbi:MAG: RES family NAD+ phosphorylase [Acidobacteriaceae bacterium]